MIRVSRGMSSRRRPVERMCTTCNARGVRKGTMGETLGVAFILPFREIIQGSNLCGGLHPANSLQHCHKIVISPLGYICHPVGKLAQEASACQEVGSCEMKTKRSPVSAVVMVQVIIEESSELFWVNNVSTLINKVATSQSFREERVITSV